MEEQQYEHQYTEALLSHVKRGIKTVSDLETQSERKSQWASDPDEYLASANEAVSILQQQQ